MSRFGLIRLAKNQVQKSLFRCVEIHLSQTLKLEIVNFKKILEQNFEKYF